MFVIDDFLSKQEVRELRRALDETGWINGAETAGLQSREVKNNLQIDPFSDQGRAFSTYILRKLGTHPIFNAYVRPLRIVPPLFNRYDEGMSFGSHVDNALRPIPLDGGGVMRIRCDVSTTLFLSEPDEYDGGELILHGNQGAMPCKLPAGSMAIYPTLWLHSVTPITRGSRVGCFFWTQSCVRSPDKRELLFDLDQSVMNLGRDRGFQDEEVLRLTNVHHNLLRQWSEL